MSDEQFKALYLLIKAIYSLLFGWLRVKSFKSEVEISTLDTAHEYLNESNFAYLTWKNEKTSD